MKGWILGIFKNSALINLSAYINYQFPKSITHYLSSIGLDLCTATLSKRTSLRHH